MLVTVLRTTNCTPRSPKLGEELPPADLINQLDTLLLAVPATPAASDVIVVLTSAAISCALKVLIAFYNAHLETSRV